MKLCFVSPEIGSLLSGKQFISGGAERQFFLFGKELSKKKVSVSFITSKKYKTIDSCNRNQDFETEYASFAWMNGNKIYFLKSCITLIKAMRKANADFYIVKTPALLLLPLLVYRLLWRRVKVVFWAQTSHDALKTRKGVNRFASAIQNCLLNKVDIVISQTKEQSVLFKENFNIDSPVIPNIYIRENVSFDVAQSDIFWCGNSSANKRQEIVFRLAEIMPEYHFCIAMNNSSSERFIEAQKRSGELSNTTFLGTVSQKDVFNYFSANKVFLNTSLREGYPNTFLQSFCAGIPVASVCIDPDSVLQEYKLGTCISHDIPDINQHDIDFIANELKKRIEGLLKTDLSQYRNRGAEYLQAYHDPDLTTQKLIREIILY